MPLGSINDLVNLSLNEKKFRAVLDGNGNFLYIGYSAPGTLVSEAKWQIQKFTYDGTYTSMPTQIDFANGNDNFDKIWSSYASYTYS